MQTIHVSIYYLCINLVSWKLRQSKFETMSKAMSNTTMIIANEFVLIANESVKIKHVEASNNYFSFSLPCLLIYN
jgi:hypothetical protein